jgi:hypothetical protein
MPANYYPSRGCVYVSEQNPGAGLIQLNPILRGSAGAPIILESASISAKDLVVPKPTLNKFKILYSFGEDFGEVNVRGALLLGEAGKNNSAFASVVGYFNSFRTSSTAAPIAVSVGSAGFSFYLTTLTVSEVDPQYNIQRFILSGTQV